MVAKQSNRNRPSEYVWLAELLASIIGNTVQLVRDVATAQQLQPMFVVAGACPNSFCGMQAVQYALPTGGGGKQQPIDFRWIKPQAANPRLMERQTLDRQPKGPHKNDPGRSRALYVQFAELFEAGGAAAVGGGLLRFGVDTHAGARRAYIEQIRSGERHYIFLIWQESWTSNPFASSKFIVGKLVYQRDPSSPLLYERPYAYKDGVLSVPVDGPELAAEGVEGVPPDRIKLNCLKV